MTLVKDLMTSSPELLAESTPVCDIAKVMEARTIGFVIVDDGAGRPRGVITDRDLAIEVLAAERDPTDTTAGDLLSGRPVVTVEADAAVEDAVQVMKQHALRRLPVVEDGAVIGVLGQADVARFDETLAGELVEVLSSARDNSAKG